MPTMRHLLATGLLAPFVVAFPHNADHYTHISPRQVQSTYDYIIVGGGTSGLTLAARYVAYVVHLVSNLTSDSQAH